MSKIQSDVNRFRQIVRGKVREELRKHLGHQELIGREGKQIVSIPVPQLELPRFVHDPGGQGVGQGEGEGEGGQKAGKDPGKHMLEAEFTVEELAQMLGEALELPRIRPKGHDELEAKTGRYTGISNVGPESLRHFKRSYRHALRRLIATGGYNPDRPRVVLDRADRRYRTSKPKRQPSSNAVIMYVMDVSGSMGADQKELVRTESFWLDAWISSHYQGTRKVYIVHDAAAKEVDRETFFRIRESGGTVISSAYELAIRIMNERFSPDDWNLYLFHFTDGENYSRQDTDRCMTMLAEQLLPHVNLFGYGQVESYGTSGDFFDALRKRFAAEDKVALSRIPDRDAIVGSIKLLLEERQVMQLKKLPAELAQAQEKIEAIAAEFGLTFFRTVFEMVDYVQMNALAAYGGFPTRYPHYRFGMEYQQLSKSYEYGLHKIYEMVINNDPTYAYLLEGNTNLDQKLVMAHVYGHADFFKNNMYFAHTNRKMIDEMANHSTRVRRYQERYGLETVERFIDACLCVDDLIDPNAVFLQAKPIESTDTAPEGDEREVGRMPAKSYMENFVNPPAYLEEQRRRLADERDESGRMPAHPERDALSYIMLHAPLENWERDILGMIIEEAYYFLPQRQTKVMNEGWASYWHSKIMTTRVLDDSEVIDYADHHSGTVATQPGRLNPYKLGLELFRDIERRWDMGQFGSAWDSCEDMAERNNWNKKTGLGRDKIFEVRRVHCDATFLDEFLTPEFCQEQKLFVSKEDGKTKQQVVSSREYNQVKQAMLFQFTNGGRPVIELVDANYGNRGELLLLHRFVGVELRWDWAEEVLGGLTQLWRRPVRLATRRGDKVLMLVHDGENCSEEEIKQEPETVEAES